eukprot:Lankesteria_metandrocarpae@DN1324_c0_g1_i1.p1
MKEMGSFTKFQPASEKYIEEYVDKVARLVKGRNVCVRLFQEMWAASSDEASAATIMNVVPKSHEDLVSHVVRQMFPYSDYVRQVEEELWKPSRKPTVHAAILWLRTISATYLRLCIRHKRQVSITNTKVLEALLTTIPIVVEQELRIQNHTDIIESVMCYAPLLEAKHRRRHTVIH